MEKLLEESMGDDWRLFRAKLVAQERAQLQATKHQKKNKHKKNNNKPATDVERNTNSKTQQSAVESASTKDPSFFHVQQQQQQQPQEPPVGPLGDLFGAAISSFFSKQQDKQPNAIFHGTTVGGQESSDGVVVNQDPFCSADELPLYSHHPTGNNYYGVSKHRWAHPIENIEAGCVLIANEKLGGVFHQTVVLVVDHHATTGTTGIVINRYVLYESCCHWWGYLVDGLI